MDAEHIAGAITTIGDAGELGGSDVAASPIMFVGRNEVHGAFVVNGIKLSVSSNFDEPIAVSKESGAAFNKITPNQIGLQIPAEGMLRGKSGMMAKDLINMIKGFGSTVKENNNAAIVKVGENAYFVANSGTGVYVVYGLLDVNKIDISQYQNVVDDSSSPLKRYETDDVFEIDPDMYDTYEIGGAFDADEISSTGSEDWNELLKSYEEYVDKYISYLKKASEGDMGALSEYPALLEKAQEFSDKMKNAESDMSASQWAKYNKITLKMLEAARKMNE
jgi:hypothetical protein